MRSVATVPYKTYPGRENALDTAGAPDVRAERWTPVELCKHELEPTWCSDCRPQTAPAPSLGPFVWIKTARLYHLPDCEEVLWDPSQAKRPGERVQLQANEVRRLLADGRLERGCYTCGALA